MSKYFAIRTIKNGSVRIGGVTYVPDGQFMPYDGRLDGMRYAFGRYYDGEHPSGKVCLWGTEAYYRAADAEWPGPDCVDGKFVWEWWGALPSE